MTEKALKLRENRLNPITAFYGLLVMLIFKEIVKQSIQKIFETNKQRLNCPNAVAVV